MIIGRTPTGGLATSLLTACPFVANTCNCLCLYVSVYGLQVIVCRLLFVLHVIWRIAAR